MKRLHVITWGCQMNVYDSARMADVLRPLGYAPAADAGSADMVILNTCHIRDRAAEKVFSELGRLQPDQAGPRAGRAVDDPGRGRVRGAGGRARDPGPRAFRRHRAGAADLPSPAGDGGARGALRRRRDRHRFPGRAEVRLPPRRRGPAAPRRRVRLPHGARGLRQVLLVLRRPLHARRRGQPSGRLGAGRGAQDGRARGRARSPCSARTSTPIMARVRTDGPGGCRGCWRRWPRFPACCACATPPRTRATWTPTWSRRTAACRR